MHAWTPSSRTRSRKYRPTTRLPMRRPIPSGNTVSTVSTSPLRMSDSRALGSAWSDTPDHLLHGMARPAARDSSAARLTNLSGVRGRRQERARPPLLYRDRDRRDQEDKKDETGDADRVPSGRQRREVVEGWLVLKPHDEEKQECPDEPVG